ncbi:MAG: hypothetical protein GX945_01615 [Lentisphaerae bacterium]|jgi:tRNA A-37 threonylcarbamoyl transferase component Bud32|nr:hypothetical protein [Lentisphaerota bacterium]
MSSPQPYCSYRSGDWRGIVHPYWQSSLSDLDRWLDDNPGTKVVAKKARSVTRVETPNGVIYVKILHRLQERGSAWKMLISGIKWLLRPSRAIDTFWITDAMLDKGILCPEPILAARRRNALGWPEDVFICREVPYPSLLSLLNAADDASARDAMLVNAAQGIAALHNQGFIHGDCIPGNLCLAPDQSIFFLDNDRSSRMLPLGKRRARLANVVQFLARLPLSMQQNDVFALFLDSYRQASATICPIGAGAMNRLTRKLQRRLALLAEKRAQKARA